MDRPPWFYVFTGCAAVGFLFGIAGFATSNFVLAAGGNVAALIFLILRYAIGPHPQRPLV